MAFVINLGDDSPTIVYPVTVSGTAVDLTGATVKFYMRAIDVAPGTTPVINGVSATVTSPSTAGIINYVWGSSDTTNAGAGNYRGWFVVTLNGGAVQTTPEFDIAIVAHTGGDPQTSSDLCTVDDVRMQLELTSSQYDVLIQSFIGPASLQIMRRCQREFLPRSTGVTRTFAVRGGRVNLAPYDLVSVTSAVLNQGSLDSYTLSPSGPDYILEPIGGALGSTASNQIALELVISRYVVLTSANSYSFGYSTLSVTGNWGAFADLSQVPADIRRAATITVASWLDKAMTAYSIHDQMDARDLRPDSMTTWSIPAAAYRSLEPYMRLVV